MQLRHLEFFIEIVQHGGFNRASAHLNIAQSALSRQIQQLEHDLGVTLFTRSRRGVQLTPAGMLMAERASPILRQFREVREEVMAQSDTPRGELALGVPPSLAKALGVPLIRQFNQTYPGVFLNVWIGTSVELRERLLAGKIDLAVYGIREPETVLEAQLLFRDPVYVIGPPGHQFESTAGVDLPMVAKLPLLMTSRPNSMRQLVEHAAARFNIKLNVLMDVNSIPLAIDLVKAGLGFSILPFTGISELLESGQLSGVKINRLYYSWIVSNSRERTLSAAGHQMRKMLVEMLGVDLATGTLKEFKYATNPSAGVLSKISPFVASRSGSDRAPRLQRR
jgi:LysR family nitrogen assimilation transcriptional regulator